MFNLNINWLKIIKEQVPFLLRTPRRINWIKAMIAPFNQIYQEFLVQYQVYIYKIGFNGQIIYLEYILNRKFSPVSGGIFISDGVPVPKTFLYQSIELKPPRYMYNNWDAVTNYLVGHYAVKNNKVWKALANNTNSLPTVGNPDWAYHKEIEYLRTAAEFNIQYDFIVNIPSALVFNMVSLRGIIDYYRLAGKRYKIVYY